MKIATVIQRFGADIFGGAELHCRYIMERLAVDHEVTVLTSCSRNYVTWENEYPEGKSHLEDIEIIRFPIDRQRDDERYHYLSYRVSHLPHSFDDEIAWLEESGPLCLKMGEHIKRHCDNYDLFIFFSFRYYPVYHFLPIVANKSVLVPTAENDEIIKLSIFRSLFTTPAAIAYNSVEEKEMIQSLTGNYSVPGEIIGVGINEISVSDSPELLRKFDIRRPYVLYVGRMEQVKGVAALCDKFITFTQTVSDNIDLVMAGRGNYSPPSHPNILPLDEVTEEDKMALIENAEVLIAPSPRESLSMVLIEAFSRKTPVLVNGDCPVLRGQVLRSGGGLYYRSSGEFCLALHRLLNDSSLARRMGESARHYYEKHYIWNVIMQKYQCIFSIVRQN